MAKERATLIFHSQKTGLLQKENTACKYSSTGDFLTAKHQKGKSMGKELQHKRTSSIKVRGNGEQVQEAAFLVSKVGMSWSMAGGRW